MGVEDYRGKKIRKGTTLRYLGTRTKGKADKICIKENNTWIRLDTTGLYYRLDYLMVIKPDKKKIRTIKKSQKEKIVQKLKKTNYKNYEISSQTDGPGVGGG